ncbi:hypothetical protein PP715_21310 [Ralstonia solanacearum]|uniref:Uncharacterized protein n=2 Tax=Ralstonia solanacearum TaxID=305 RepID=A0A5H2PK82_RALSL|nr:hypothetical protein [Ralstonia solanacearum]AEG68830.1 hypothetical protein RSPO_c01530 [Ralstonia solanacearum Po82]AMP70044.1 hypothetical protein UW163_11470 [Ralstonia solanacearum]AYB60435.1 hypothetical protein C2124_07420 [Ralstonia solanacearum]MBB6587263.1 hypothetical protein [Ralstonia solanacearum]MCG3577537.1 hypothetical protein [Ralstonia solanacearum]
MNIPGFSTNGLKMMYEGAKDALAEDDATPSGQDKPYGVREYADWRELTDAIEAELDSRNVSYPKIVW